MADGPMGLIWLDHWKQFGCKPSLHMGHRSMTLIKTETLSSFYFSVRICSPKAARALGFLRAMATLDSDVPMVPVGEPSSSAGPSSSSKKNKRFEIKKWNAVALWAWGTFSQNPNPSFLELLHLLALSVYVYIWLCAYLGFGILM